MHTALDAESAQRDTSIDPPTRRILPADPPLPFSDNNALHLDTASAKMDASGAALGRRYARMDELGAPFGVTVDFQTVEDETVTLRERDSMTQIRMPMADVAPLMARLVTEEVAWKVWRLEFRGGMSMCALARTFVAVRWSHCRCVCCTPFVCVLFDCQQQSTSEEGIVGPTAPSSCVGILCFNFCFVSVAFPTTAPDSFPLASVDIPTMAPCSTLCVTGVHVQVPRGARRSR